MRIAFINLCHCDPVHVARTARRLTAHEDFDMYIHLDAKTDETEFLEAITVCDRTVIINKRHRVYWGGFNAVKATIDMLRAALESSRNYDYYMLLQNLDYPIRTNAEIAAFFTEHRGMEFIRACRIACSKDWHYSRKYRIYNKRDDDFYLKKHIKPRMYVHYICMLLRSIPTIMWNGVIREAEKEFPIYYGAAQWAVTRECAEYLVRFFDTHPVYNAHMEHVQFPDEEYFHTAVHNSPFKYKCARYDEPEQRWLVNWRNLHYFEQPVEGITVFTEEDFDKLMAQKDVLFARKFRTGISDTLLDRLDSLANGL